ncbi:MAG: AmmeMemoRadiSam system radical SAM enzyme [Proteobacteria bacterium]|nr:AmmeMemoRadiSam system radical SAM enzyme [Pseudomonadota bacterium]MBU1570281.1 AmmeMemoRadiSam system radical SAM enzyme [Pseudomonadota bacterium]
MEALLYEHLKDKKVRCNLCKHNCTIEDGKRGICGVRENREGVLNTLVYGKLIARQIDPIEKKPLFHFLPGSLSYSIATAGCNFKCLFCQNADISQMPDDNKGLIMGGSCTPEDVVASAVKANCKSISYTYTEPTVYFEFARDTAILAQKKGLKNIFVTNGYMSREALGMIQPFLDAANVDLKAYNKDFYRKMCGAKLENVKETLVDMKSSGIFVEVTTLLIPGLNDDKKEIEELAMFITDSLGPETPWHISRFHPTYKLEDRPSTPLETLVSARKTGMKCGLKYVYTGNVPGEEGESTFCYNCGKMLIERIGFYVKKNAVENGMCPHCRAHIDGVW